MPDDNQRDLEVDQYQDELSEESDDGGGCAETWEALNKYRQSNGPSTTRRGVLKSVGASAGISAFGVSAIRSVEARTPDNSAREKLSEEKTAKKVEAALETEVMETVLSKIPGGRNRLDKDAANAFRVVAESGDKQNTFTQILIPVRGGETALGFATDTDSAKASAGVILESGEVVRARAGKQGNVESVNREPDEKHEQSALKSVRNNEDYQQYVQNNSGRFDFREDKAAVSAFEGQAKMYLHIPVVDRESNDSGPDRLVTAELDKSSGDVITIQASAWDCWVNCVALRSTSFWGFCWTVGCSLCLPDPSKLTCVACLACVGVVGGSCALSCGIEQIT
ncbi:hypothetical protein [Halorubrum trapanicum]|uniref:hypothetical protein n=1 Tax=Halorubrum trapanicum TaxID=29284 RepID=UPI0012FE2B60|nr:hypothetical protein [Halorubrum trapanicum]